MRSYLSVWDLQTGKGVTILLNGLWQRREERITTREWRCRLTNDGEPCPRQAVRRISSPRFESTLVCSKLFLWRDWKYLTFLLMWLWISFFFVQLRTIKTSCVLFSHMQVWGELTSSCPLRTLPPYIHLKIKKKNPKNFIQHFREISGWNRRVCRVEETTHIPAANKDVLFQRRKKKKPDCVWFRDPYCGVLYDKHFNLVAHVCQPPLRCRIKKKAEALYKTSSRNEAQTAACKLHFPPGVVIVPSTTKVTSAWKS